MVYTLGGGENMVNMISLKELRPELPAVMDRIDSKMERYIITRRGKPVAVLLSVDDYEGLLETIEILSDKDALKRIKAAQREIRLGKTVSLEQLRKQIENV
jgi:antitoxin YefM